MGFNKKVLSKAVSELGKAKAPAKPRDIITDPAGQWKYPGQKTRIPGNDITMQGVNYPVWGQPNVGKGSMMQPGQNYLFPGADYVDETPMARKGGTAGKLSNDNDVVTKVVPMKFDLPELKGAEKINDKVTLAMSPDSTGLYKIGKDIEKFCGIPEADVIRDVKAGKDKPEDAIIYGMSNIMNGGKDIYLWINGTRLQGSAKEKGVDAAIMEIVSHESLHITRKLLTRAIAKSKGISVDNEDWIKYNYGDGKNMWPAIGDVSEKHPIVQIDEEAFATAEGYVTERILPYFLEMAKKYLDINKDKVFKKGGTLQSKKFSSNISATNKLFAKNKLFQNKKSKIFDPNAKFKSGGSKLGPINLNPNPLSHYELNYGFNLPTKQDGGENEDEYMDLTDEEIQAYRDAGYEVDEEPEYEIGGYVQHEIAKAQKGKTVIHTDKDVYDKAFAAESDSSDFYNNAKRDFNKFNKMRDRFNTNLNPEQWQKASNEYDKLLDLQEKKWHTFPYKNGDVSHYIPGYTANYKYKGPRSGLIIKPVGIEKFYREGYDFPKFKKPVIHNIIQELKDEVTPLKTIPYQEFTRPEQTIIPAKPYVKPKQYSGPRFGTLAGDEDLDLSSDATQQEIEAARRKRDTEDWLRKTQEYQNKQRNFAEGGEYQSEEEADGPIKPYVTSNPKEFAFRNKMYSDSLSLYNQSEINKKQFYKDSYDIKNKNKNNFNDQYLLNHYHQNSPNSYTLAGTYDGLTASGSYLNDPYIANKNYVKQQIAKNHKTIKPTGYHNSILLSRNTSVPTRMADYLEYKKPVQPVKFVPKSNKSEKIVDWHGDEVPAEYLKKYPPIYVSDLKDPRIGRFSEAGNIIVYKPKPTVKVNAPKVKAESKMVDLLPLKPIEKFATLEQTIIPGKQQIKPFEYKWREWKPAVYDGKNLDMPEGYTQEDVEKKIRQLQRDEFTRKTQEYQSKQRGNKPIAKAQVGLTKKPLKISDPDEYAFRKAAYDDSSTMHRLYDNDYNAVKKFKTINEINNYRNSQIKSKGKQENAASMRLGNPNPEKVETHTNLDGEYTTTTYKKPVQPVQFVPNIKSTSKKGVWSGGSKEQYPTGHNTSDWERITREYQQQQRVNKPIAKAQTGLTKKPFVTSDPDEFAYRDQMYKDSLNLYDYGNEMAKFEPNALGPKAVWKGTNINVGDKAKIKTTVVPFKSLSKKQQQIQLAILKRRHERANSYHAEDGRSYRIDPIAYSKSIIGMPKNRIEHLFGPPTYEGWKQEESATALYKKPVQPVKFLERTVPQRDNSPTRRDAPKPIQRKKPVQFVKEDIQPKNSQIDTLPFLPTKPIQSLNPEFIPQRTIQPKSYSNPNRHGVWSDKQLPRILSPENWLNKTREYQEQQRSNRPVAQVRKEGGDVESWEDELSDDEIEKLRRAGYIVEELD